MRVIWTRNKPFLEHKLISVNKFSTAVPKFISSRSWDSIPSLSWILDKELSFPLKTSPGNVTNSAVFWEFSYIYLKSSKWKTSFFCAVKYHTKKIFQKQLLSNGMFSEECPLEIVIIYVRCAWYFAWILRDCFVLWDNSEIQVEVI